MLRLHSQCHSQQNTGGLRTTVSPSHDGKRPRVSDVIQMPRHFRFTETIYNIDSLAGRCFRSAPLLHTPHTRRPSLMEVMGSRCCSNLEHPVLSEHCLTKVATPPSPTSWSHPSAPGTGSLWLVASCRSSVRRPKLVRPRRVREQRRTRPALVRCTPHATARAAQTAGARATTSGCGSSVGHDRRWCDVLTSLDVRVQMPVEIRTRDWFNRRISASNVLRSSSVSSPMVRGCAVARGVVLDLVLAGGKDSRVGPDPLHNGAPKRGEAQLGDLRGSRIRHNMACQLPHTVNAYQHATQTSNSQGCTTPHRHPTLQPTGASRSSFR